MKPKFSKRKFYNKWDYKVTLKIEGAGIFRYEFDEIVTKLTETKTKISYTTEKALGNKDKILEILDFLLGYDSNQWQKRVERDSIDFYTNDADFYRLSSEQFADILVHKFEPDRSLGNLEEFKILARKLPHNKFKYKVYLRPHKLAGDKEEKSRYLDWLAGQGDKISASKSVKEWFMVTDWNWDRRYIWVEDSDTMLLLKLRNSEVCGRVYEYCIVDK